MKKTDSIDIDVDIAVHLPAQVVLQESDGELYLVEKAGRDVIKPDVKDSNNLLFSLVNLVKPPDTLTEYGFYDLERLISPKSAIDWIEKKGFPEIEDFTHAADSWDGIGNLEIKDKRVSEFHSLIFLSFSKFRRQVVTLYLLVHLWQGLLLRSDREITKYLRPLVREDFVKRVIDLPFEAKETYARHLISELINERLKKMQPLFSWTPQLKQKTSSLQKMQSEFVETPPEPEITLHTSSLFTVAYFQLACIITQKKDGGRLKVCPIEEGGCGRLFWGHGNRKFCPYCDRRTAYSRRKKREAMGK